MTHRIGFVGTGVMGTPMARNLLAAGHAVAAFDADAARVEALCEHGATGCASPGEAAAGAAFVFTDVAPVFGGGDRCFMEDECSFKSPTS